MPDPSLSDVMEAIADQITSDLGGATPVIAKLQVTPRLTFNPTPPAIDIYPSDPFQEQMAFGGRNVQVFFSVRARVSPADQAAGQDLLLSMMDPRADTSVVAALLSDRTLSGKVQHVHVEPPSDYGLFVDPGQQEGLLGCVWRTGVVL
jgi:hypothetical protein